MQIKMMQGPMVDWQQVDGFVNAMQKLQSRSGARVARSPVAQLESALLREWRATAT